MTPEELQHEIRTITRYIDDARAEMDAYPVRTDLIGRALKDNYEYQLAQMERLLSAGTTDNSDA